MKKRSRIYQLYLELLKKYGPAKNFWPQWCAAKKFLRDREIIALGAILTQRTSWYNADLSLRNLKKAGLLSIRKISCLNDLPRRRAGLNHLSTLIRPAGFYQTKPKRLLDFCSFLIKDYGSLKNFSKENLKTAREKLLAIRGIGPETADTILLYALDKPTFVIDEYTKRFAQREKLARKFTYDFLQNLFQKNLPQEVGLYQDFHALIIIDQKGKEKSLMEKL